MKILWVKAGGLVPLDSGGKIRSFHIAKELARHQPVSLFLYYPAHSPDQHCELGKPFEEVELHPVPIPHGRGVREGIAFLSNWFSPLPYSVAKYFDHRVAAALERRLHQTRFDVLLCDFIFPACVVPWAFPIPKVIFAHNVETMIWQRHAEVASNPLWRFVLRREWRKMKDTELRYLRLADHVLTVSENDREVFARNIPPERITPIPTGVDTEYFTPRNPSENENLVFTGSMDWMPNEDGIIYFFSEILPRIRQTRPSIVFWVVGREPTKRVRSLLEKDPGIRITGRVEDIRPYISKAAVYVVPLRIGGGTRLKIFEAMAMGKAVVSTTIGAEGLPVTDGRDISITDTPEEFAASVIQLLDSPARRQQMGEHARKLVEENFGWLSVARLFENRLTEIVSGHGYLCKGTSR